MILSNRKDNISLDFMQRFMIPNDMKIQAEEPETSPGFMQELEAMRKKAQPYFSSRSAATLLSTKNVR